MLAGLGFSGAFTCIQILIAAHYSGPLYGRILATIVLIDTLCGALGTQTIARVREWQGDYSPAFIGMADARRAERNGGAQPDARDGGSESLAHAKMCNHEHQVSLIDKTHRSSESRSATA